MQQTCFETKWSLSVNRVIWYENVIKGSARDAPFRNRYGDLDYVINSYEWVFPWLKNYFFSTAIFQITCFVIALFFFLLITNKLILSKIVFKKHIIFIIYFISSLIVWFQAPELRFFLGPIIFINSFIIAIITITKFYFLSRYFKSIFLIFFLLLFIKNKSNYNYLFNHLNPIYNYKYIIIEKFQNFDLIKTAGPNDRCVDQESFCAYEYYKKLNFLKSKSYLFIEQSNEL